MIHALRLFSHVLEAVCLGLVGLVAVHGIHRLRLLWAIRGGRGAEPVPPPPGAEMPPVTVQLPLYNEREVAARLVLACSRLDWPRDRFELQVLDDSTDDTGAIVDAAVAEARQRGVNVQLLRRAHREGFKAGALAAGLDRARGDFVAVFDADFVPAPDFLVRLLPHFADPRVGMVQARWGHQNADESVLTRAQAVLLDGHFVVDHAARAAMGAWFNFNGTAGVWRRACIDDAGGWQGDTLTEDLDLSYRAQLAGWRFVYAPEVVVPAEVPSSVAAFQVQQRRWAVGSIQTLRKLGRRVLRSGVPRAVRAEALAHLGANLAWLPAMALTVLLPWTILLRDGAVPTRLPVSTVLLCTLPNLLFYARAAGELRAVPGAVLLALGMVPAQSAAVVGALTGVRLPFARTPKRGGSRGPGYRVEGARSGRIELGLAATHLLALGVCVARGDWPSVSFLALFALGLGWVGTGWRGERAPSEVTQSLDTEAATRAG